MEQLEIYKYILQGKINRCLERGEEIKNTITFILDDIQGKVQFSEVYGSDAMLYMDSVAVQGLSTMIYQDIYHFVVDEDVSGLLVYLQKKYSGNFCFLGISPGENIAIYASNIADSIAREIVQEFIDYDEDEAQQKSIWQQKLDRSELYREMGIISETVFYSIQKELSGVLEA